MSHTNFNIPISIFERGSVKTLTVPLSEISSYNQPHEADVMIGPNHYGSKFLGFQFEIVNRGTHFCGYIKIDENSKFGKILANTNSDDFEAFLDKFRSYKGFTYCAPDKIGFDCAHYDDILLMDSYLMNSHVHASYKTYSFVRNECMCTIESIFSYLDKLE